MKEGEVAVTKKTPAAPVSSMPTWETLEEFVRTKIQATMQSVLEEELTAFLGRGKSERRSGVDVAPGYRNGYGKPRKLALSCGTIELQLSSGMQSSPLMGTESSPPDILH